ncbi:MAG: c-type cytochrome [Nitrospirae bacterium]|nr:c-type cytochrome [Nitrospirota bacterium]
MKVFNTALFVVIALSLVFSVSFASRHLPEERGKTLFNDPKAFGGSTSCNTCHPGGKGLEKSGMTGMTEWETPAGTYKSLEEAINICITAANKGKAIDPKSPEMKDMIAYIKSLGMGMKHEMPMKEKGKGY